MGGDIYMRQGDKFIDSNRALSQRMTSTVRAFAAGIADMALAGYAAYEHTPEGLTTALENAMKAATNVAVKRTPLLVVNSHRQLCQAMVSLAATACHIARK